MGTHPIFESDFDCLTERDEPFALDKKIRTRLADCPVGGAINVQTARNELHVELVPCLRWGRLQSASWSLDRSKRAKNEGRTIVESLSSRARKTRSRRSSFIRADQKFTR